MCWSNSCWGRGKAGGVKLIDKEEDLQIEAKMIGRFNYTSNGTIRKEVKTIHRRSLRNR